MGATNIFECDKEKARLNFQKHRLRFTEGCRIFEGHTLTAPSHQNTGESEERYVTIGVLDNETAAVVVWTRRLQRVRIISVRKARRKERDQYYAHIEKTIN